MFTLFLLYVCFNLFAILVTTRHSYSYRYNLSYLILLHLQSCDSYNLHDLYTIFYTDIWLILSVKRTPYECAMKNYSIQDMLYTPGVWPPLETIHIKMYLPITLKNKLVLLWAQLTKIYHPLPTSVQLISITKTLLIVLTKNERDPPLFTGKLLIKF